MDKPPSRPNEAHKALCALIPTAANTMMGAGQRQVEHGGRKSWPQAEEFEINGVLGNNTAGTVSLKEPIITMRQSLSLTLLFFASHSFIGCVIDPSVINESSSDMSPAEGGDPGGSEVIIAGESAGETAGTEAVGGDSAGESAGTSAGDEIVGGETAGEIAGEEIVGGETAGETAGEMAGEAAGEIAGEEIVGGETAGEIAGETAGETAGEMAGEDAGETAGEMAGEDQVIDTQCDETPLPILPGGDCRLSRFSCGDEYECIIPQNSADSFECGCLDEQVLNCCGTCDRESCDGIDQDCDGVVDEGVESCEPCLTLLSSNLTPLSIESPLVISGVANTPSTKTIYISKCAFPSLNVSSVEIEGEGFRVNVSAELPYVFGENDAVTEETVRIDIIYTPQRDEEQTAILTITSNDANQPSIEVNLSGQVVDIPIGECPIAQVTQDNFSVSPESVIILDASPSFDLASPNGRPVSYEWIVSNRPNGSTSSIVESFTDRVNPSQGGIPDDASTPQGQYFVDLTGIYQFEIIVRTQEMIEQGINNCGTNTKSVYLSTSSEPGFRLVLTWDTPRDFDQTDAEGTDLDLHLRHPLSTRWASEFFDQYDCYYANPTPDWGEGGVENNPTLDIDDINGNGPEQIRYRDPEERDDLYRIGVLYYNNRNQLGFNSWGPSTATIFVYFLGELVFTTSRELIDKDHFWEPAAIRWGSIREVVEIDRYYETLPDTSEPLQCVNFPAICLASETCIDNICQNADCMDNEVCE